MVERDSIDCHQHFWEPDKSMPRWINSDLSTLDHSFTPDELEPLLARNGVASSVAVRTSSVGAVVVWIDLRSARRSREQLTRLAGRSKLRGVREPLADELDS